MEFKSKISDRSNVEAETADTSKAVVAKIPKGYNSTINVRIVPDRDIKVASPGLGCQPRQDATRRNAQPVDLPQDLVLKLKDANKQISIWLAKDTVNAELFMAHPVEAMTQAGVDFTRKEQKTLLRAHQGVKEVSMVAPEVNVKKISVSATAKGSVKKPAKKTQTKRDDDCGCD
ncbi:MAG: hypothetical protein V3T30_01725 [Thermodesulfobacteriota bacterium]